MSFLYKQVKPNIKEQVKEEILHELKKEYQITIDDMTIELDEILNFLSECRNICAHDERLFNTLFKINKKKIYRIHYELIDDRYIFKSRTFDVFLLLKLFLTKKDFFKMTRELKTNIYDLDKMLNSSQFNKVLIEMGFPKNWEEIMKNFLIH